MRDSAASQMSSVQVLTTRNADLGRAVFAATLLATTLLGTALLTAILLAAALLATILLAAALLATALLATILLAAALLATALLTAILLATALLATALLATTLLALAGTGLTLPAALLVRRPERADLDAGAIWHAHRHPIGPDSDARTARPTGRRCAGIGGGWSAVGRGRNPGQRRCTAGIRIAAITRGRRARQPNQEPRQRASAQASRCGRR
jgi:hypothetical protein